MHECLEGSDQSFQPSWDQNGYKENHNRTESWQSRVLTSEYFFLHFDAHRSRIWRGYKEMLIWAAETIPVCPTLCNPMDHRPSGSSVHGILQARILEWVAIPPPGDLPDPGIKPESLHWQVVSLPLVPPVKPNIYLYHGTIARSPNNLTESEGQKSSYTAIQPSARIPAGFSVTCAYAAWWPSNDKELWVHPVLLLILSRARFYLPWATSFFRFQSNLEHICSTFNMETLQITVYSKLPSPLPSLFFSTPRSTHT